MELGIGGKIQLGNEVPQEIVSVDRNNESDELTLWQGLKWFWLTLSGDFLTRYRSRKYNAGRRSNPFPHQCESCGWIGRQIDFTHTYRSVEPDDVEPVIECPKCGDEA